MPKLNIVELTSFKVGDLDAGGAMPADGSLTAVYGMSEGTVNINIGEANTTPKYVEESKISFVDLEGNREADITLEIIGAEASVLAALLGGTYVPANVTDPETINFSPNASPVYKALKLSGKNSDGLPVVYNVPKAHMLSSQSGTVGRGNARGWILKGKINVPVDGSGVAQNWLQVLTGNSTA